MSKTETKTTAVKIIKELYAKFKTISFESDITLQKLTNRSMHKYVTDESFRKEINNYEQLYESGSRF